MTKKAIIARLEEIQAEIRFLLERLDTGKIDY